MIYQDTRVGVGKPVFLWSKHFDFHPSYPGRTLTGYNANVAYIFDRVVGFELKRLTIYSVIFEGVKKVHCFDRCPCQNLVDCVTFR